MTVWRILRRARLLRWAARCWRTTLVYVILAAALTYFSSPAWAHWDGDSSMIGHRYQSQAGQPFFADPQEMAQHYVQNVTPGAPRLLCSMQFGFGTNNKQWRVHVANSFGNCTSPGVGNTITISERHCPVGFRQPQEGDCEPIGATGSHSYVAVAAPAYVNAEGKLWELTSSAVNGECFNVTYARTGWEQSDEDDFTVAQNDGDSVGNAPDACPGHGAAPPFPGMDPGFPGEVECREGERGAMTWPYDGGGGESVETLCTRQGCRAEVTGLVQVVCLASTGICGGAVELTGEMCLGTEDAQEGSDSDPTGIGGELSGVEDTLRRILNRQATQIQTAIAQGLATVAGLAAVKEAIEGLAGSGGEGECDNESCDGYGIGEAPEGADPAVVAQGFADRVAGAPIMQAMSGLTGTPPTVACPSFTSDPIAVLNNMTLTVEAHCGLWEDIAPYLSAIMLIIYTLSGAFIIVRA